MGNVGGSTRAKLDSAIDAIWPDQLVFLKDLIRCPSTLGNEAGAQRLIQSRLESLGLQVDHWEPDPEELRAYRDHSSMGLSYEGRPVVVGVLPSHDRSGRSLILNGHVDVVSPQPIAEWHSDPFEPRKADGKLYGRGSLDMKGGITAMLFAVNAIQNAGIHLRGDVIVQTVIEEECTGSGTLACMARGYRADGALLLEPQPVAVTAEMGVLWCRVKVRGRPTHALSAGESANPIDKAYVLIQGLKELEHAMNSEPAPPPYDKVERPVHFNIGTIEGGDWPSNVPGDCTFEVRVGFYPNMQPSAAQARIKACLFEAAQRDPWLSEVPPEVTFFGMCAEGTVIDSQNAVIKTLAQAHERVTGMPLQTRVSTATSDMRFFAFEGIPVTRYGPSGDGMHGPNEHVDLASLKETTRVVSHFILDWAG